MKHLELWVWGKENKKIKKKKLCDNVTPSLWVCWVGCSLCKNCTWNTSSCECGEKKKKLCDNVTLSLWVCWVGCSLCNNYMKHFELWVWGKENKKKNCVIMLLCHCECVGLDAACVKTTWNTSSCECGGKENKKKKNCVIMLLHHCECTCICS